MKLALNRPVKIVIIGAGGTGGNVIPHLYRIAFSSNRPCKVIICDGDIVERKNLIRQNFAECDIGENKAQVMAERYSEVFGIETEYIPDYIESEEELYELLNVKGSYGSPKPIGILIGAVDNNRSRIMCNNVFNKLEDIIYIDSGKRHTPYSKTNRKRLKLKLCTFVWMRKLPSVPSRKDTIFTTSF